MAYYLNSDDRALLDKLLHTNQCKECGGKLEALYNLKKHLPYLQCKDYPEHEGIIKEYHEPRELNIPTKRREMEEKYGEKTAAVLEQRRLPTSGALTKSQAMDILKLVYPEVPDNQIIRTAILCKDFGLHPLLKEIYIIPFETKKGKLWTTVLGINATRKMMARYGSFSYADNTPRVMTEEEQKTIFGEVQTDRIVAITKLRTKGGLEAQGYGHYLLKDMPYGIDKGNTKANMAFIRSERQAFSRLFPDTIPQDVEVIDEAYIDVPNVEESIVTEPESSLEIPPEPPESTPAEKSNAALKRDPATIKTIEQLARALKEDFGLSYKEQYAALNIKSWSDLAITPAEAYQQIAAVRSTS